MLMFLFLKRWLEDINTSVALLSCSSGKLSDSRGLTAANIYDKALLHIRKRCQHGNNVGRFEAFV